MYDEFRQMCIIVPGAEIPYMVQRLVLDCSVRGSNLDRNKRYLLLQNRPDRLWALAASYSGNNAFLC